MIYPAGEISGAKSEVRVRAKHGMKGVYHTSVELPPTCSKATSPVPIVAFPPAAAARARQRLFLQKLAYRAYSSTVLMPCYTQVASTNQTRIQRTFVFVFFKIK